MRLGILRIEELQFAADCEDGDQRSRVLLTEQARASGFASRGRGRGVSLRAVDEGAASGIIS